MAIYFVDLPIKMVIVHSYVSLPEGRHDSAWLMKQNGANVTWWFTQCYLRFSKKTWRFIPQLNV